MTLNKQKEHINKHRTQVVLLDGEGSIYESCDSIFNTQPYIGRSLREVCFFFESELGTILNSQATKLTFEKVKIASKILPGCYDFIFSKQIFEGKKIIIWEIFDYTRIYNEYTFIQQLQNELDIQEQFEIWKDSPNHNKSEFFQDGYSSNNESNVSQLLNNLKQSRFEEFYAEADKPNSPFTEFGIDGLKSFVNELILDIDTFVKRLRKTSIKSITVSHFFNPLLDWFSSVDIGSEVPSTIKIDKKLVKKLLRIIALEQDSASIKNTKVLEVGFLEVDQQNAYLTFIWKEKAAHALTTASSLVKMSSLQSLVTMIGGSLDHSFEVNDSVLVSKILIPAK